MKEEKRRAKEEKRRAKEEKRRAKEEKRRAKQRKKEGEKMKKLPIPSFPGYYYADKMGNIFSLRHSIFKLIKVQLDKRSGYLKVGVRKDGKRRNVRVHRLVCEAFTGEVHDDLVVRHLNGDKRDNRASNLAWGTQKKNGEDYKKHLIRYRDLFYYVKDRHPEILDEFISGKTPR